MIIFGRNSVLETLKENRSINKILITKRSKLANFNEIVSLCKNKKIPIQFVEKSAIERLCSGNHQGILAFTTTIQYLSIETLVNSVKNELPFFLMLDEIHDPHNMGAIIRTAEAAKIKGIIIPNRRNCQINETVAKVSSGAIEHISIARVNNLINTINYLKKKGFWIIGSNAEGININKIQDLNMPIVLILGNEGKGVRHLLETKCDYIVAIPMYGKINSLNVSVAAGILIYDIIKRRCQT